MESHSNEEQGEKYSLIRQIAPHYGGLQRELGNLVAAEPAQGRQLRCIEIGVGDGFTSRVLLQSRPDLHLTSVDNQPVVIREAEHTLGDWVSSMNLTLVLVDAQEYLRRETSSTYDIVVSSMTLHNFWADYRSECLREIHRILAPNGLFINADRYALDPRAHHAIVTMQIDRMFEASPDAGRTDVLREWVLHFIADDHPDRIQRESDAVRELTDLGFSTITIPSRCEADAILTARKAD